MKLFILIPLLLMIVSDYKIRKVVLWQLILFGLIVAGVSLAENGLRNACMNLTVNMLLSLFIGLCVYIYFLLRYKSVQSVIGKGDILFILFLTPFFSSRSFLIFMLISFVATLGMWGIVHLIRRKNDPIPLISGLGVCLCALLIYKQLMWILW